MAIPWPIAGAGIHSMYNQMGFQTAWNLLPPEHRAFDNTLDHKKRYGEIVQALAWLKQNPEVLVSEQAQQLLKQNQLNFFINTIDIITVTRLQAVLDTVNKFNDNT